ncbi:MAG: hypothetical protein ACI8QT_001980, partial [Halioglobus sp.]
YTCTRIPGPQQCFDVTFADGAYLERLIPASPPNPCGKPERTTHPLFEIMREQRMPLVGDEIEENGYRLTIIDLQRSRVGQVPVTQILNLQTDNPTSDTEQSSLPDID